MTTRLEDLKTTDDLVIRVVVIVTAAITIVGMLALVRAAVGGGVEHVTVRIDNQAGLPVQVGALDPSGDRVGLGVAAPKAMSAFHEIPDIGGQWTLVAAYGGQEVHRKTLARADLAAANWMVAVPAGATAALERQGFQ
jgi:hypothetical protein